MEKPQFDSSKEEAIADLTLSRRRLLRALAVGGGATAAVTILPDDWIKPIINFIVLPAHAQTSGLPAENQPPGPTVYTLSASADTLDGDVCWVENITATMSPAVAGVEIQVTVNGTGPVAPPNAFTNASGVAVFASTMASEIGVFSLIFSFTDPAYGGNTATLGPYQGGVC